MYKSANRDVPVETVRRKATAIYVKRTPLTDFAVKGVLFEGLEFKYVFIAAVNNRIIPLPSAINKTDAVSESESITSEKCLLYVAMTRAQKGVYITSYGKKSDFLKS